MLNSIFSLVAFEIDTGEWRRDLGFVLRGPANDFAPSGQPYYPNGLWSDGDTMWVVDDGNNRIFAYELATGVRRPELEFDAPGPSGNDTPWGLWSNGRLMWVADPADDRLYTYNMPPSALLESLEVEGVNIGTFVPSTTDFEGRSPSTLTQTTVHAAEAFAAATVDISPGDADDTADGHQVNLGTGDTTITITVTNDTLTSTYTVVVTATSFATLTGDAALSALSLSGADFGSFSATSFGYRAAVANSVDTTTVSHTSADPNASVVVSPIDADTGTAGHQVELAVGRNEIVVAVESSDGRATEAYTVIVERESVAPFGWAAPRDLHELDPANTEPGAVWSDGATMWVADLGVRRLHAYDLATRSRDATKDLDISLIEYQEAAGLWSDGETMWVAARHGGAHALDLHTGARRAAKDIDFNEDGEGHGNNWYPEGIWSDGETMWVADWNDDKIFAYDLDTNDHRHSLHINGLGSSRNRLPAGLWSDGDTIWVTDRGKAKVFAYELAGGARRADLDFDTLEAAGNLKPRGLWSDGRTMWVSDTDHARKVFAYNMPANATLTSLALDGVDIGARSARTPTTTRPARRTRSPRPRSPRRRRSRARRWSSPPTTPTPTRRGSKSTSAWATPPSPSPSPTAPRPRPTPWSSPGPACSAGRPALIAVADASSLRHEQRVAAGPVPVGARGHVEGPVRAGRERRPAVQAQARIVVVGAGDVVAGRVADAVEVRVEQGSVAGPRPFEVESVGLARLQGHLEPVNVALRLDLAGCRAADCNRAGGAGARRVVVVMELDHKQRVRAVVAARRHVVRRGLRVGARNPVVAGQAACLYSLMRPSQRVVRTSRRGSGCVLRLTCCRRGWCVGVVAGRASGAAGERCSARCSRSRAAGAGVGSR